MSTQTVSNTTKTFIDRHMIIQEEETSDYQKKDSVNGDIAVKSGEFEGSQAETDSSPTKV